MQTWQVSRAGFRPSLLFILITAYLILLWIAGGSSRADVLGQAIVRAGGVVVLAIAFLFGQWPAQDRSKTLPALVGASVLLTVLQIIPLPPAVWQELPGRALFQQAAALTGEQQPWRPWAIVPGAALNAAASLIVPVAIFALGRGLAADERRALVPVVLALIAAGMIVGLLQFSGMDITNPFVNVSDDVSGVFSNRNHFALFLSFGCLLAPVWAFSDSRALSWRSVAALGLCLLFLLTILATGSRAGILFAMLALAIGGLQTRQMIAPALRRMPRWARVGLLIAVLAILATLVLASIANDRAASFDRALSNDVSKDMRRLGLPTVLEMIREYFPFGSGFGGFDPLFRMHEPFSLLKPTYFNHVHNDWLEVVLDAGLLGLMLLVAGVIWWGWVSIRAWCAGASAEKAMARSGSTILLLIMIASAVDYPARTPLVMAMIMIASLWLEPRRGDEV